MLPVKDALPLGLRLGLPLPLPLKEAVSEPLEDGDWVGDDETVTESEPLPLTVADGEPEGELDGLCVGEGDTLVVMLTDGECEGEPVGLGLQVALADTEPDGLPEPDGVSVGDDETVTESVPLPLTVADGEPEGELDGLCVGEGETLSVPETVPEWLPDGLDDGLPLPVFVTVGEVEICGARGEGRKRVASEVGQRSAALDEDCCGDGSYGARASEVPLRRAEHGAARRSTVGGPQPHVGKRAIESAHGG